MSGRSGVRHPSQASLPLALLAVGIAAPCSSGADGDGPEENE